MLWSACTDDWNEHYQGVPGGMADQPSLLENIAADPQLANFYKAIVGIGGASTLNSPQQLTVWAPMGMTEEQADSVIQVYKEDSIAGIKFIDNRAIKQFFQNHVALYARPISSLTDTTIAMLNKKYMRLVGESPSTGSLDENKFSDMVLSNNGILYKTENLQSFFPNLREYAELNGLDSVSAFFKLYDHYELDENSSIEGGIVDGSTVYLDSVTNLSNQMLRAYGLINREDSNYIFLAPTNEVWKQEYEKYSKYFTYTPNAGLANLDSLVQVNAQTSILRGRFFNMSKTSKYNQHPEDSLVNTQYYERQVHNPRTNVYYNPSEMLEGLKQVQCSNGILYVDDKGVIDPKKTFFTRKDIEAEYSHEEYKPDNQGNIPCTANSLSRRLKYYTKHITDSVINNPELPKDTIDSILAGETPIKEVETRYSVIKARVATNQANVTYELKGTYSNVYYNIYVVSVDGPGQNNENDPEAKNLSTYFTVQCKAQNDQGKLVNFGNDAAGNPDSKNGYMLNPKKYSADDENITGYADLSKLSNFERVYITSTEKNSLDTILIAKAKMFDFSSIGLDKGIMQLYFETWGPSSVKQREEVYTRTMRFDEIILVPFETKEEAEAAADDLNAINDEVLEEIKKSLESTKE